jgi:hypothetical protein
LLSFTGIVFGWLIWTIEAFVDFGGPIRRWRDGAKLIKGTSPRGFLFTTAVAPLNAALTSSRLLFVFAWWCVIALTVIAGIALTRGDERTAAIVGVAAALPIVLQYLVYPSDTEARFLVPAYVALAIPSGIGVAKLATKRTALAITAIVLIVLVPWQVSAVRRTVDFAQTRGRIVVNTAATIRSLAEGEPCIVGTDENAPVYALASGCRAASVTVGQVAITLPAALSGASNTGERRFFVTSSMPDAQSPVRSWPMSSVEAQPAVVVHVFAAPPTG